MKTHAYLVGGWVWTPLKNDGVRQLGWWYSQYDGKNKIHVPNHQPVDFENHGVRQLGWWHSQYDGKNKKCSKPPTRWNWFLQMFINKNSDLFLKTSNIPHLGEGIEFLCQLLVPLLLLLTASCSSSLSASNTPHTRQTRVDSALNQGF